MSEDPRKTLDAEDKPTEKWGDNRLFKSVDTYSKRVTTQVLQQEPQTCDEDDTVEMTPEEVAAVIANENPQIQQEKTGHQCRTCGKSVTAPTKTRWFRSVRSERGFQCEKCGNVFCLLHVVRVSTRIESLFFGTRFVCQLCLPKGHLDAQS
ncbi:MAG: hypothetical protein V1754_16000 [Pseudomonadota bacterium]